MQHHNYITFTSQLNKYDQETMVRCKCHSETELYMCCGKKYIKISKRMTFNYFLDALPCFTYILYEATRLIT